MFDSADLLPQHYIEHVEKKTSESGNTIGKTYVGKDGIMDGIRDNDICMDDGAIDRNNRYAFNKDCGCKSSGCNNINHFRENEGNNDIQIKSEDNSIGNLSVHKSDQTEHQKACDLGLQREEEMPEALKSEQKETKTFEVEPSEKFSAQKSDWREYVRACVEKVHVHKEESIQMLKCDDNARKQCKGDSPVKSSAHKSHPKLHNICSSNVMYHCPQCSKSFAVHDRLNEHIATHEKDLARKSHPKLYNILCSNKVMYHCSQCTRSFAAIDHLKEHIATHEKGRPHECTLCSKRFKREMYLNMHVERVHSENKPYECDVCGKTFVHNSYLVEHSFTHIKAIPLQCGLCSVSFWQRHALREHLHTHSDCDDAPYHCHQCNMPFMHERPMMEHSLMYHDHKMYRSFVHVKRLKMKNMPVIPRKLPKQHMVMVQLPKKRTVMLHSATRMEPRAKKRTVMVHSPEKRYKCAYCNKSFASEFFRDRHALQHAVKTCNKCGQRFDDARALNVHILSVHTEKHGEGNNMSLWASSG